MTAQPGTLKCPYCGGWVERSMMIRHWNFQHPNRGEIAGAKNIACPWCPLRFDTERPENYLHHTMLIHPEKMAELTMTENPFP